MVAAAAAAAVGIIVMVVVAVVTDAVEWKALQSQSISMHVC